MKTRANADASDKGGVINNVPSSVAGQMRLSA
jgi:hypothetical protein